MPASQPFAGNVNLEEFEKIRSAHLTEIIGTYLIDGFKCNFLADIGANQTIMNERLVERDKIRPIDFEIINACREMVMVIGVKTCKIQIGKRACVVDVLICKDLVKDCLLGMDLLTTCPYFLSKSFIRLNLKNVSPLKLFG